MQMCNAEVHKFN